MLLITDGRFSGGTHGFSIGHVGPEAAVGGPIGLIKNGDVIEIDTDKGFLKVLLSSKDLAKRKKKWKPKKNRVYIWNFMEIFSISWSSIIKVQLLILAHLKKKNAMQIFKK